MEYTPEQIKIAKKCGALGYNIRRTAILIDSDNINAVQDDLQDISEIAIAYEQGEVMAKYEVDAKLFELARNGDTKAIEMYIEMRDRNMSE